VILRSDSLELEKDGRVWVRDALSDADLGALDRVCEVTNSPGVRLSRGDNLSGIIGDTSPLTQLAGKFLPRASPVRIVVFDKSLDSNWSIPWHQDRVIAVRDKHPITGFGNWTKKAGTWHVEPPIDLLRNMIFARVPLDDTDEQNGCLELALGTHAHDKVNAEDALETARSAPSEICRARRGDVLFIKALTLHRSISSRQNRRRRTLRIDYCAEHLPKPLAWAL